MRATKMAASTATLLTSSSGTAARTHTGSDSSTIPYGMAAAAPAVLPTGAAERPFGRNVARRLASITMKPITERATYTHAPGTASTPGRAEEKMD